VALREKEYGIWNAYSWADSCAQVRALALGLMVQGVERGEVVAFIGRNRPHGLWAELAAQSIGAMSLGIYEDALGTEVAYLLAYA
jgi:long-chain acyl-CoA synthetase